MRIAWKPLVWGLFTVWVLAVLLGALAVRYFWSETLQSNGIETLEWQGLGLSLSGVSLRQLELTQSLPTRKVVLQGRELALDWRWPDWDSGWTPRLMELTAKTLKLDWYTKQVGSSAAKPQASSKRPWPPDLPAWMPSEVIIQQFEVTLPCEAGRCPLAGDLSITSSHPDPEPGLAASTRLPVKANLQLDHEGHYINVQATLDGSWLDELSLAAELAVDGTRYVSVESGYHKQNANGLVSWDGAVDISDLPRTDWLLAWLQTWQSIPTESWPEQPETATISADWKLQGAGNERFLAQATGGLKVKARVPQPWFVPGVGKISGSLEIALDARQEQWQPDTLNADIELKHPAAWVKTLPELMQPGSLSLSVRPGKPVAPVSPAVKAVAEQTLLPLNVELSSRAGADVSMRSHLAITTRAPWRVELGKTHLHAALPELEASGWLLTKPRAEIELTGWLDTTRAVLKFKGPTILKADKLEPLAGTAGVSGDETLLKGLRMDLAHTILEASYLPAQSRLGKFSLSGPLGLTAKQVKHPQLRPQPWRFEGALNGNLTRTNVTGLLKAKAGTSVNLDLNVPYQGPFRLAGKMRVSGEQEAEALSRIFTAWPELLTVSGGTVSANAAYEQPKSGAVYLTGNLVLADWSGTYDRTTWSRMNGSADFLLDEGRMKVSTPELTVAEVNPGIPFGPVQLAGQYEAPLGQLAAGQLVVEKAVSGALGGEVTVQPESWDLAQAPVTIPVKLKQLNLARLLQLYPTEGLAGTGILSGTLPVLFDPATGIRVKQGRIDALKPGGRIQLTAERLKALGNQSEAMELVAKALKDFRYSVLDSGINYDENGTLLLSLHLKGNSPEVGKGQPVVLNINLEENIPALLRSLQLSGKVSDAVTERVKNLLKKRERD